MAGDASRPPGLTPKRAARWSSVPQPRTASNRLLFRLIGIPALAFAGVLVYRGLEERFTLPACDSARAKATLATVLEQLKVEPLRDEPITTISSDKQKVACTVALPLSDGGTLNIDYSFFWNGSAVDMRYAISRRPAGHSAIEPRRGAPA